QRRTHMHRSGSLTGQYCFIHAGQWVGANHSCVCPSNENRLYPSIGMFRIKPEDVSMKWMVPSRRSACSMTLPLPERLTYPPSVGSVAEHTRSPVTWEKTCNSRPSLR